MRKTMKKIRIAFYLFLFGFGLVRGQGAEAVKVEVLTKTGSSWDGKPLPDYPRGKPEITEPIVKL